jgi:tetratricopeptide (TPR) repeat protein
VYSRILYTVVIYSYKKQTPGAFLLSKQAALKAIEIDASYAKASSIVGVAAYQLQLCGQLADCVAMLENAIELGPLNDIHYLNLGIVYLLLNCLDEACQAVAKYGSLHPDSVAHYAMMSHILLAMGKNEEALVEARLEVNDYWRLSTLSFASYAVGDMDNADELLKEYVAGYGDSIPGHIASLYAFRGEKDHAFEWLERAYDKYDSGLLHIINFQTLRNLWEDPRRNVFLEKLNLPNGRWLVDKRIEG